jgi:hypothetical protein
MKKLVFILSSNYSGSHYLSLLLGSHSKAQHLGEMKNLIKDHVKCNLLKEINQLQPESLYPELFSRTGEHIELLIDTSKKPKWAKQFIHNEAPYEIKVIHLLRDPRALTRRWKNKYTSLSSQLNERRKVIKAFPKKALELLFSSQTTVYLYKWLKQNQDIVDFTKSNALDTRIITYRDLSLNPETTLSPIMKWLNVSYEESQLKYWQFKHHGTQKAEYEWVKDKQVTRHVDLRWKDVLTKKDSLLVTNNDELKLFLERTGLVQTEDGLNNN